MEDFAGLVRIKWNHCGNLGLSMLIHDYTNYRLVHIQLFLYIFIMQEEAEKYIGKTGN